jgi:signal transduction histidine kinase
LTKFLTIPVIFEEKIVAVIGVANKEKDYTEDDIRQLTLLMDSAWKISERITLIKDLTAAKEKAEESDRLKSAFLANMSHEIRTPMNGILGFTNLLLEPDLGDESKDEYIRIIHQSGKRMLNTVNDIVEISKIEAGMVCISHSMVNIQEVLTFVKHFFQPEIQKKGLALEFENHIWETNLKIKTDQSKLESILNNLVKNAIKFTDTGKITISCRLKNEFIEFCVEDTGIGIPTNRQNAVFNRFEQADIGDTRAFQGSGLGLAISKSYVEMLGGKIWLESEEGTGSKFFFTLPHAPEQNAPANDAKTGNSRNQSKSLNQLNILVVEDDEVSAIFLKTITHLGRVPKVAVGQLGP